MCFLYVDSSFFEQALFTARCKLYRKAGAEFKERGIGEMRVLKKKNAEKYRCVMRRDVVHKLCANFTLINGTLSVSLRHRSLALHRYYA